jgi:hypothetical protein
MMRLVFVRIAGHTPLVTRIGAPLAAASTSLLKENWLEALRLQVPRAP